MKKLWIALVILAACACHAEDKTVMPEGYTLMCSPDETFYSWRLDECSYVDDDKYKTKGEAINGAWGFYNFKKERTITDAEKQKMTPCVGVTLSNYVSTICAVTGTFIEVETIVESKVITNTTPPELINTKPQYGYAVGFVGVWNNDCIFPRKSTSNLYVYSNIVTRVMAGSAELTKSETNTYLGRLESTITIDHVVYTNAVVKWIEVAQ